MATEHRPGRSYEEDLLTIHLGLLFTGLGLWGLGYSWGVFLVLVPTLLFLGAIFILTVISGIICLYEIISQKTIR